MQNMKKEPYNIKTVFCTKTDFGAILIIIDNNLERFI